MAGDNSELGFGCVADPFSFDCTACDALIVRDCRLRRDEALRDFELARRWRWLTPTNASPADITVTVAGSALADAHAFAERQGIAVPAALAHRALPMDMQRRISETELEALMMISPAFMQTSPRTFLAIAGEVLAKAPLPIAPTPGIRLEVLATASTPLGREEQIRLFKRLAALARASAYSDRKAGLQALGSVVEADLDYVMTTENWSLAQVHRAAVSADFPTVGGVADARRFRLLTSISALELLAGSDPTELRAEHESLKARLEMANIRLAINLARAHTWTRFLLLSDLAQEAYWGLRRAVERFDPYRGFAFSTYATPWIKQALRRYIANTDRTIRLPVHVVDKLPELRAMQSSQGRAAEPPSLSSQATLAALAADRPSASWERLRVREHRVGSVPRELTYDPDHAETADRQVVSDRLRAAVARLHPREQRVVELRYGLEDNRPRTLEEVGREFGLTRERIRQVEAKAFRNLKVMPQLADPAARHGEQSSESNEENLPPHGRGTRRPRRGVRRGVTSTPERPK